MTRAFTPGKTSTANGDFENLKMKTYFYVLRSKAGLSPEVKGEIGCGGFALEGDARNDAVRFLTPGSVYTGAEIYSINSESKKISHEYTGRTEHKIIWQHVGRDGLE
jgi:hypothetical protein